NLLVGRDGHSDAFSLAVQETSGSVMAKGVEDTAFYRYHRLVSLNEVGGDPASFSAPVSEFHAFNARNAERYPDTLLASTTHDTKRSEDFRARIDVLAEMPRHWAKAVLGFSSTTAAYRSALVDANTEYLVYQTLVGAHPLGRERARAYLLKAVREAKQGTS